MSEAATLVTGWLFVAAAAMLWSGWVLQPVHVGPFFEPQVFARIHTRFRRWIWLFRIHLFGYLVTVMALVALATLAEAAVERVLVWPATAVLAAGAITSALAAAFYYHFGAWGALDVARKPAGAAEELVRSLQVPTEYVTCLVRFGRVFFGLGQVTLAVGLWVGGLLPAWIALAAALLGGAAMVVTMAFPDDLHFFRPVFHLNAAWLLAIGLVLLVPWAS